MREKRGGGLNQAKRAGVRAVGASSRDQVSAGKVWREEGKFTINAQFGSKWVKFSQCTVQFEPIVMNYRLRQYKIVLYMHIYGHAR